MLYLTNTRPDIMFATNLLSRFMSSPNKIHLEAAKLVLQYLRGTSSYGICYTYTNKFELHDFSDSDWASSIEDRRSTSGYIFNLGAGAVSWCSKKKQSTTLSSSEAEYITVTTTACQAV
ncbi:secreted RxLR effector protein 161-like [Cornus florida]|uniref:secreted RxLR effector protein 161-like n=1 Tax=Cornus florida TaxID=4283 RepID=UPI00289C6ED0|nr:secreted RxLR effector protein 161-like [Cornus florida]